MPIVFVLDACSLIALLKEESGSGIVLKHLQNATTGQSQIIVHKITLTEVTYDLLRSGLYINGQEVLETCYKLPLQVVDSLSDEMIIAAAGFKVKHRISFADSFVLALAQLENAAVITSDHHEFDSIEKAGDIRFEWIR